MFIIQPATDLYARFVSSNVTADEAVEYDPETTYVTGDTCKVTTERTVYKCIADAIIVSGTSYPVQGFNPPGYLVTSDATNPWMELRAINNMAMFDQYINTQTKSDSGVGHIETVLRVGSCDSLALFNVVAKQVQITLYDNQGAVVFTETQDAYTQVTTIDDYFFTDVSYKRNLVFKFGLGIGGTIKIKISNAGSVAKCGMIVLGKKVYLGSTRDEVDVSITDYSSYKTDSLGRTKLSVGFFADVCSFTLYNDYKKSSKPFWAIRDIVNELRGKLTVWCIDNTDETWKTNPSLMICGYFTDNGFVFRNGISTGDFKIVGVV